LLALKLKECPKPQVEQRNKSTLTVSIRYDSKQSVVKMCKQDYFRWVGSQKNV